MKHKIPEKIKIGGHWYKVLYPYAFSERMNTAGQSDFFLKEIRLSDVDPGGSKRASSGIMVTLIHEILHTVDLTTGYNVFDKNESAVEGFSEMIYQILIDNGWLLDA